MAQIIGGSGFLGEFDFLKDEKIKRRRKRKPRCGYCRFFNKIPSHQLKNSPVEWVDKGICWWRKEVLKVNPIVNKYWSPKWNCDFSARARVDPQPGTWGTIELASDDLPILLQNVVIEYAKNGIYLSTNRGIAALKNSEIALCDVGVLIGDPWDEGVYGNLTVEESQVHSNTHGVYVRDFYWEGETWCLVTLENIFICNNSIFSNGETGVTLASISRGNITIYGNKIFSNQQCGINIYASLGVSVSDNIISANRGGLLPATSYLSILSEGFIESYHIQSSFPNRPVWAGIVAYMYNAYPLVVNNSISYQFYGIYFWNMKYYVSPDWYAFGSWTIIRHNDIYENSEFGVSVSTAFDAWTEIDAEYNYWGNESGPYHESLNPPGTGNPVNGNGIDLDFIPFLTMPGHSVNERPVAHLSVDSSEPSYNETVTFDASASTDDGRIDYYFFDFGDGTNSSWTPLSVFVHKYDEEGVYNATLIVMDDFGVTSLDGNLVYVEITVIPEFPSFIILSLFMLTTLLAVIVYKRKHTM